MNAYRTLKEIGRGSYGCAMLCEDKVTRQRVVIKMVNVSGMDESDRKAALQEVSILSTLRHPCIIGHIKSFEDDGYLCIVCELAEQGDLGKYVNGRKSSPLSEERILTWFVQLSLAVGYVHQAKVLHRDLKLQNVFLNSSGQIKLGDFGIARVLKHTQECAKTVVGTPYYLSPEICENKPYNVKSDVWALGCILYELATRKHPFQASNLPSLIRKILTGSVEAIPSEYSPELSALVRQLLAKDPNMRPPLRAVLQLPFLRPYMKSFAEACLHTGIPVPTLAMECLGWMPALPRVVPTTNPSRVAGGSEGNDDYLCDDTHASIAVQPAMTVRRDLVADDDVVLSVDATPGGSPVAHQPVKQPQPVMDAIPCPKPIRVVAKPVILEPLESKEAQAKHARDGVAGAGNGAGVRVSVVDRRCDNVHHIQAPIVPRRSHSADHASHQRQQASVVTPPRPPTPHTPPRHQQPSPRQPTVQQPPVTTPPEPYVDSPAPPPSRSRATEQQHHRPHCPQRHSSCKSKRGMPLRAQHIVVVPGLTGQEPASHRVEALRAYLTNELGEGLFMTVYKLAVRLMHTGVDVYTNIVGQVGTKHAHLVPLISQWLRLEMDAY